MPQVQVLYRPPEISGTYGIHSVSPFCFPNTIPNTQDGKGYFTAGKEALSGCGGFTFAVKTNSALEGTHGLPASALNDFFRTPPPQPPRGVNPFHPLPRVAIGLPPLTPTHSSPDHVAEPGNMMAPPHSPPSARCPDSGLYVIHNH